MELRKYFETPLRHSRTKLLAMGKISKLNLNCSKPLKIGSREELNWFMSVFKRSTNSKNPKQVLSCGWTDHEYGTIWHNADVLSSLEPNATVSDKIFQNHLEQLKRKTISPEKYEHDLRQLLRYRHCMEICWADASK